MRKLLICIFGPSLLGGAAVTIIFFRDPGASERSVFEIFYLFQFVTFVGFLFTIIPSVAYYVIMEAWFRKRSDPSYIQTILISALIGATSGIAIGAIINPTEEVLTFALIGVTVGCLLGPLLEALTLRTQNHSIKEQPIQPPRD